MGSAGLCPSQTPFFGKNGNFGEKNLGDFGVEYRDLKGLKEGWGHGA